MRGRQRRAAARACRSSLPQRSSALIDERVLDVDQHADRRDRRATAPRPRARRGRSGRRAAEGLGDLDAHDAEIEQLVDQRPRDLRLLVHLADERPDLRLGELADAVAEQLLVFGQDRERLGVSATSSVMRVTPWRMHESDGTQEWNRSLRPGSGPMLSFRRRAACLEIAGAFMRTSALIGARPGADADHRRPSLGASVEPARRHSRSRRAGSRRRRRTRSSSRR